MILLAVSEHVLDSSVISNVLTGLIGILGTVVTYRLSTKKSRQRKATSASRSENSVTYAGYENLILKQQAELDRMYLQRSRWEDEREAMRNQYDELHQEIHGLRDQIEALKHAKSFTDYAQGILERDARTGNS